LRRRVGGRRLDRLAESLLAPAVPGDRVDVLRRHDDDDLPIVALARVAGDVHHRRVAGRQGGGGAGELVDDRRRRAAGVARHGAVVGAKTALDVERLPFAADLVLGETERVLARLAERRAVDLAGAATADVPDDELERAADRRVGAGALAERVDAVVQAD